MAYLNRQEREALAQELVRMNFGRAKGKLRRMDDQSELAYIRNSQTTGELLTRYNLHGLGVVVTLVERMKEIESATDMPGSAQVRLKPEYELTEVIVDPMPENNT